MNEWMGGPRRGGVGPDGWCRGLPRAGSGETFWGCLVPMELPFLEQAGGSLTLEEGQGQGAEAGVPLGRP